MNDCHERRFRVSLDDHFGMSHMACECGQAAPCKEISVALLLKRKCNLLFVHCIDGYQDCDYWCVFLSLQKAVVALNDRCAWLIL